MAGPRQPWSVGSLGAAAASDDVSDAAHGVADGVADTEQYSTSAESDDPAYLNEPRSVWWTGFGDRPVQGFLYWPTHPEVAGPPGELPPLMVTAHSGPTLAALPVASAARAFFTSRGIAVLDVNYSGSSGFGRAYRDRLDGQWGHADVADCVAGARHLAETGIIDARRLAIRGKSAGGLIALSAVTFFDVFTAAVSWYGVADLATLATDTHKLEAHYADRLVGPWPEAREIYEARSPMHHIDDVSAPVLMLQGADDVVVDPLQADRMAAAMAAHGIPARLVLFDGEGHGFRNPANVTRAWELELDFLAEVWNLGQSPTG